MKEGSLRPKFNRERGEPESPEKIREPKLRFEGDETVLQDLVEHQEDTINVLVMLGGGARPFAGGATLALQEAGLRDSVDYLYTLSTGTAAGCHFMSGEAKKNRRMYKLMTVSGLLKDKIGPLPLLYGNRLRRVVEGDLGHVDLNIEAMLKARPKFFAAVTDLKTGTQEFIDIKNHPDRVSALMGSAAAPTPNQIGGVEFEGRRVTDASISNPFPIKEIIEEVKRRAKEESSAQPKKISVTVIMNTEEQLAKYGELGMAAKLYAKAVLPGPTAEGMIQNQNIFNEELQWLRDQKDADELKYLLVWATEHVDVFDVKEHQMNSLFDGSQRDVAGALARAKEKVESSAV